MDKTTLARAADPAVFVPYIKENAPVLPTGGHGHRSIQTTRTDTYRGHKIVVRTSYEIEVDGESVNGHLGVGNDGRVHYHPLPNYSFTSAIELAHQLIDSFPERFCQCGEEGDHSAHGDHGAHGAQGEHAHGEHAHGGGDHGDPA
ncbi:MAG: hypothetical protein ABR540_03085 [Acidimicrobiales bacterium]